MSLLSKHVSAVSIEYKKGTKEWNANKTEALCVGKGLCEFKIGLGAVSSADAGSGDLSMTADGKLCLKITATILSNPIWRETFANGKLYIGRDLEIPSEIRVKLKNCPTSIMAGNYAYSVSENLVTIIF